MIDVVQTRDTFDRALADGHEAEHLHRQLAGLRQESGAAREALRRLQARHRVELADVERLSRRG
jgi:hypothetical protein